MLGGARVLLLEDLGVEALLRAAVLVVGAVEVDAGDEEEAEHLDALRAEAKLLVEVLADGAADHLARDLVLVDGAVALALPEEEAVAGDAELDGGAVAGADLADAEVLVELAAGLLLEVVAVEALDGLAADARLRLDVELQGDGDGRAPAALVDGEDLDVGRVVGVLDGGRGDLDLLDELALVGVDGVEPVDHVVLVGVGGRVAERAEGVHGLQRLLARALHAAVYALRLVDDDDGVGGADEVDGPLAAGLLAVLVDVVASRPC